MSVTYGFYDSLNHDRTYSTLQFSSIFDGIISDGIYATYLDAMEVVATDPVSMNIGVKPGRAWFNHTWTLNDAVLTLTVATPDIALPRIDSVVLEVASGTNTRANRIFIKQGTAASSPVAPTLINGTNDIYQYALANIRVGKQADVTTNGGIRGEDIINKRGTPGTPFVTGLINTIEVDNLVAQWSSQYDRMFNELEQQISQAASQTLIDGSVTTEKLASDAIKLEFHNVVVRLTAFEETEVYEDYPYSVNISLLNVIESMIPEVIFGMREAVAGVFAPVVEAGTGYITIYASEILEGSFSASIDEQVFLANVIGSGTMIFSYNSSWNTEPEAYGITIDGSVNNGDTITVVYNTDTSTADMSINASISIPTILCWKGAIA